MKTKLQVLLVYILLFSSQIAFPQYIPDNKFKHLTVDEGLDNNFVYGFIEDARGYMWIFVNTRVTRYDGYRVIKYPYNPAKANCFYGNTLDACVDKEGELWLLTNQTLLKYNEPTDDFTRVTSYIDQKGKEVKLHGFLNVEVDAKGNLVFNNDKGKVLRFNPNTHQGEEIELPKPNDLQGKKGSFPVSIYCDKEGVMWYYLSNSNYLVRYELGKEAEFFRYKGHGCNSGKITKILDDFTGENLIVIVESGCQHFFMFDKQKKEFQAVRHHTAKKGEQVNSFISSAVPYSKDVVLLGYADGLGMKSVNLRTGELKSFVNDINYPNSLSGNQIWSMYRSSNGLVWIGTRYQGANILDPNLKPLRLYTKQGFDLKNSLSDNKVTSYLEGKDGNVWIGTFNGLNRFDPKKGKFVHYVHSPSDRNSLSHNHILSLATTRDNTLWITPKIGGLNKYDPKTKKYTHYKANPKDPESVLWNNFLQVVVSSGDKVIVGYGWGDSKGTILSLFDRKTEKFKHFSLVDPVSGDTLADKVHTMYADSYNNVWFSSTKKNKNYVCKFDVEKQEIKTFVLPDSVGFNKQLVECFVEEAEGKMWVGTRGFGVFLFDETKMTAVKYNSKRHNLPGGIKSIQKDNQGNLWLGTIDGLYKFDPVSRETLLLGVKDGAQSKSFEPGSMYTSTGEMYFSGPKGLNVFRPEQIKNNENKPPVWITKFNLFNQVVSFRDKDSPLQEDISTTKELTLTHEQNIFSFELTALNYTNTNETQYAYKLEGLENKWNNIGTNRVATYTNLNAGDYVFRAKAANNDGVWNTNGVSLNITILPPWWETWWFRTLVATMVIGGAFGFYKYRTFKLKKQQKILEDKVQERTAELQEANEEIQVQNEEMAQQAEEMEQQRDYLQEANESISLKNKEVELQSKILAEQRDHLQEANEMITASINYAKRIQQAILPMEEELAQQFDEHFVLFRPRDVVSGDFYWMHEGDQANFVAVVDCTGHGVPGAFMSMIGSSLLNRIVGEMKISDPAQILAKLHELVVKALRQNTSSNRDGMDMGLCVIHKNTSLPKLEFAGAKSTLFVRQPNGEKVEEHISSRMSVGGTKTEKVAFERKEILLEKDSVIYLTTDGYIDQHRPSDRRRLGSKRLREQLEQIKGLSLADQKTSLEKYLDEYMGDEPQRDDIAVVGIKLQ
ncbi:two-component regulator propeller domain-containing protein [Flammeovirgaceae bacterium SG7u.111]|nr:two-component regulator propeller domain-containing protein [Flammeovirgaceae bacterium SG7u.132]WPO36603.1 two-component regulator propeller domain-containing protein [Flammeovirgaceae bacterium SG7u.111]